MANKKAKKPVDKLVVRDGQLNIKDDMRIIKIMQQQAVQEDRSLTSYIRRLIRDHLDREGLLPKELK